jgi:Uma2 family endonuclease
MSVVQRNVQISVEEYLEGEKSAQVKHEYVRGRIYAMVGTSRIHNRLSLALASGLRNHLIHGECEVFISDMKVRIGDIFYYPDVVVTCSKTDTDPYFCTEPILIVEVLSPGTEALDRLDKRLAYQSLSSLKEYILVSQDKPQIQAYRRAGANWDLETYGEGDVINFASVDLEFAIGELYRDVAQ